MTYTEIYGQSCGYCGGTFSMAERKVLHTQDCPANTERVAPTLPLHHGALAEKIAATPPINLAAARFKRAENPSQVDPAAALHAALEWYEEAKGDEFPPLHIMIFVGRDAAENGGSGTRFFQAGGYRHHAQMGLCLEGMHMVRESGQDD